MPGAPAGARAEFLSQNSFSPSPIRFQQILQRIDGYDATQPVTHRPRAAPVHDALAVCAIIDPTIQTTQFIPVDVEVYAELSIGRTVCDFRSRGDKPANVHFATDADEPKFVLMLLDILGRTA